MTKDDALALRPGFKVLGLIVLLLALGTPLLLWWQGRQEVISGGLISARSLKASEVEQLCRAQIEGNVQPGPVPTWDSTEWVWRGTVRLSEARPSAAFSCVVPNGGRPVITLR